MDDELLRKAEKEGTSRRIPRDDVAALAIAALTAPSADNRCACSLFCNPGWPPLIPGMCSDALAVADSAVRRQQARSLPVPQTGMASYAPWH